MKRQVYLCILSLQRYLQICDYIERSRVFRRSEEVFEEVCVAARLSICLQVRHTHACVRQKGPLLRIENLPREREREKRETERKRYRHNKDSRHLSVRSYTSVVRTAQIQRHRGRERYVFCLACFSVWRWRGNRRSYETEYEREQQHCMHVVRSLYLSIYLERAAEKRDMKNLLSGQPTRWRCLERRQTGGTPSLHSQNRERRRRLHNSLFFFFSSVSFTSFLSYLASSHLKEQKKNEEVKEEAKAEEASRYACMR